MMSIFFLLFMHNIFLTMKLNAHANDQKMNKQKEAHNTVHKIQPREPMIVTYCEKYILWINNLQ